MTWPAVLLAAYPADWRARYGDELEQLVTDLREHGRRPAALAFDLMRGAAAAWLTGGRDPMSERSRGALITVLWSWVAFAATAAFFGHDLGRTARVVAVFARFPPPRPTDMGFPYGAVPGLADAYHVLLAAGIVGIAATLVAAVPFALQAARRGGRRTYVLMAVPLVVAAAWIGGLRLIPAGQAAAVFWLLLGVAGIAAATQAVVTIVRNTEFSDLAWRIGGVCAAAVTAAMLTATGATIAWGVVYGAGMLDVSTWLTVAAILAVTTGRAVIALVGTRDWYTRVLAD